MIMRYTQLGLLVGISIFLFSSCAKVFYSSDAYELAQEHKSISIVPPSVTIDIASNADLESLKQQQNSHSLNFQKEMYSRMLKRKSQGKMAQGIQDLDLTNTKLRKAGYPETFLSSSDMCEILGVDAVMGSNFSLSRPISDGAMIMLYFIGSSDDINEVNASISIHDCSSKKLIWNYNQHLKGGMGSTASSIVDGLMGKSTKKMPWIAKKRWVSGL